ncbi:hypothetical protein [Vallitalea guaymasensis]|uniref:hypothetical protein n=1 Tax=Vallitalea guaymasensis TaxID=1185412 RepID=UPI000DE1B99D|nr:hypothetical protein [Vallitalea guaymasensis]
MKKRNKLIIKPTIMNPYYDKPNWFESEVDIDQFVFIDRHSLSNDVKQFIILLFGYNDIEFGNCFEASVNNFLELQKDELAMSGGPTFIYNEVQILPSCCCGLEDLEDLATCIKHKKSPWLGHDPYPCIEYSKRNKIKIWSDDYKENKDAFYISCTYTELLVALHEMKRDLISFIEGPCFDYLARFNLKYANNMINHLKKLLIDV